MSKAKPEILSGINIGDGNVYIPGKEKELAARLNSKQIDHLKEQGAIAGDWTPGIFGEAKPEEVIDDNPKTEDPAKEPVKELVKSLAKEPKDKK